MKKSIIAAVVAAGVAGAGAYAHYQVQAHAKQQVDEQLTMMAAQTGINVHYQKLKANVFDGSVVLRDINVKGLEDEDLVHIASVRIEGLETETISERMQVNVTGLNLLAGAKSKMPPGVLPTAVNATYHLDSVTSFDDAADLLTLTSTVTMDGVMSLDSEVTFRHARGIMELALEGQKLEREAQKTGQPVPLQVQLQQQTKAMQAIQSITEPGVTVTLANQGKLQDIANEVALLQQLEYAELKTNLQAMVNASPTVPADLKAGLVQFLESLNRIQVSAKLPEDLAMKDLQTPEVMGNLANPEKLAEFVNLKVEAL